MSKPQRAEMCLFFKACVFMSLNRHLYMSLNCRMSESLSWMKQASLARMQVSSVVNSSSKPTEPVLDEASVARAHAGISVLMLLGCMLTYADVC